MEILSQIDKKYVLISCSQFAPFINVFLVTLLEGRSNNFRVCPTLTDDDRATKANQKQTENNQDES